jgi:hypothetical protein
MMLDNSILMTQPKLWNGKAQSYFGELLSSFFLVCGCNILYIFGEEDLVVC